ncbi:hypothetical protein KJ909_03885, partial [Patescibacteria group bacterium]|nr:hypothetical protein [Patescibacteria group bacterium]
EGFKMILDATVIIGSLRISGPINGGWGGHDSSPPRKTGRLLYHPMEWVVLKSDSEAAHYKNIAGELYPITS